MKYGESSFDILYLIFAISFGLYLIIKRKNMISLIFGTMTLLLGIGDAFHLIPRVISYFSNDPLIFYKGLGKLITSISMTIFYIFLEIARKWLKKDKNNLHLYVLSFLALIRLILCAFPQNEWFISPSSYMWGIYRNIPFAIMGIYTVILWFKDFRKISPFKFIYILVSLSFIFYLITVLGAPYVEILGMMMLPKTICYILMIICFFLYNKNIYNKNTKEKTT